MCCMEELEGNRKHISAVQAHIHSPSVQSSLYQMVTATSYSRKIRLSKWKENGDWSAGGNCIPSAKGIFPLRQFPLCQFPLRQFPFGQLPTLSIPTLSIPIWSMLTKWELTKWELTKWEVDEVGKFTIVNF